MAKGEISRFEQFLPLSLCFQKAVCCRGVRKRRYDGKGENGHHGEEEKEVDYKQHGGGTKTPY